MKIFIDSADLKEIKYVAELGICDGVTTNPTLIAKSGQDLQFVIEQIVNLIAGPVSVEVIATEYKQMVREAEELSKISGNIVVKLPLTQDGCKASRVLSGKGIRTNVTLCFSAAQAIMAAKAGATYVSPFIGRLDDVGENGLSLIKEMKQLFTMQHFETKILSSSIRSVEHVVKSALYGADAVTLPFKIYEQLFQHPLTDKGLSQFLKDWDSSGQKPIVEL